MLERYYVKALPKEKKEKKKLRTRSLDTY